MKSGCRDALGQGSGYGQIILLGLTMVLKLRYRVYMLLYLYVAMDGWIDGWVHG